MCNNIHCGIVLAVIGYFCRPHLQKTLDYSQYHRFNEKNYLKAPKDFQCSAVNCDTDTGPIIVVFYENAK